MNIENWVNILIKSNLQSLRGYVSIFGMCVNVDMNFMNAKKKNVEIFQIFFYAH